MHRYRIAEIGQKVAAAGFRPLSAGYAERQSEQGLYAHRPGGGRGRMRGRCAADGCAIPARLNIRV